MFDNANATLRRLPGVVCTLAVMLLAVLSAVITPTPDAITMMYLFVPMYALYFLGIAVCWAFPPPHESPDDASADQVAV